VKKIILLFLYCLISCSIVAQVAPDSLPPRQDTPVENRQDTTAKKRDTGSILRPNSVRHRDTTVNRVEPLRDSNTAKRDTGVVRKPVQRTSDTIPKAAPVTRPVERREPLPPAPRETDSAATTLQKDSTVLAERWALIQEMIAHHPYYNFDGEPIAVSMKEKKVNGKETMFYFLSGLLIYFGFIRLLFGKYLSNLYSLFFRVSMRQQQIREQLMQSPLPGLLLNLLFYVSGGCFLSFVAMHYQMVPVTNQWALMGWCALLLAVIYIGKLILLKLAGWIFSMGRLANTYLFIVFLVNKMIGIFLLPVLVMLAFAGPVLFNVTMTLTFVVLVIFLLYRFIIAYNPIRNEIKVSQLHFFLYLCAFEIAPLLLIYKVLLIFVERSY
jgi:hypothetical protein